MRCMNDLATLTLAHEEHLDDVVAGYGGGIEIDVIRSLSVASFQSPLLATRSPHPSG